MNINAGRPLRLELYGVAVAGSVVAVLLWDRSRLQEELLREVLRQLPQRVVIQQNNNQAVNVNRMPTDDEVVQDVLREIRKNRQ
jgi:hypothetical protein